MIHELEQRSITEIRQRRRLHEIDDTLCQLQAERQQILSSPVHRLTEYEMGQLRDHHKNFLRSHRSALVTQGYTLFPSYWIFEELELELVSSQLYDLLDRLEINYTLKYRNYMIDPRSTHDNISEPTSFIDYVNIIRLSAYEGDIIRLRTSQGDSLYYFVTMLDKQRELRPIIRKNTKIYLPYEVQKTLNRYHITDLTNFKSLYPGFDGYIDDKGDVAM